MPGLSLGIQNFVVNKSAKISDVGTLVPGSIFIYIECSEVRHMFMCLYDISYVLHFTLVLINDELLGMPFTYLFEVNTSHVSLFNVF